MYSFMWAAVGILVSLYVLKQLRAWRLNYLAAKASGFPVIIVPFHLYQIWWILLNRPLMKMVRKLPESWQPRCLDYSPPAHSLDLQYGAFKDFEDIDTYITVSPRGNMVYTANAELIRQITTRRNGFNKPLWIYRSLRIYGPNIVATEGHDWKRQRKTTGPSFTEDNNRLVWAESIRQAQLLIKKWMGPDKEESKTVTTLASDLFRLTLYIMAGAGFGIRMRWPGIEDESDQPVKSPSAKEFPSADGSRKPHQMTHYEALRGMIESLLPLMTLGPKLLKRLPFKKTQRIGQAYEEWGQYMDELLVDKRAEIAAGSSEAAGLDLMRAMIKGADAEKGEDRFTDAEIIGNTFIFLIAGHESTANTVHFALIFLATRPASQRRLQTELDALLGTRPIAEWAADYDEVLPHLFGGMAGAVLNEALRLLPPVITIPKCTGPGAPQTVTLDARDGGLPRRFVIPADSYVGPACTAVHRNPKYWPHGPPSDPARPVHPRSNTDNDLEEFRPERWLPRDARPAEGGAAPATAKELLSDNHDASDTSAALFRPPAGAYIPFSAGPRACIGRRFAQIEVLALLAAIFHTYSVELAVDRWASDADLERMTLAERRAVWEKAKDEVLLMLRVNTYAKTTLQLQDGKKVPIRLVKRGKERFDWQ